MRKLAFCWGNEDDTLEDEDFDKASNTWMDEVLFRSRNCAVLLGTFVCTVPHRPYHSFLSCITRACVPACVRAFVIMCVWYVLACHVYVSAIFCALHSCVCGVCARAGRQCCHELCHCMIIAILPPIKKSTHKNFGCLLWTRTMNRVWIDAWQSSGVISEACPSFLHADAQESWMPLVDKKADHVWKDVWQSLGGEYQSMAHIPQR